MNTDTIADMLARVRNAYLRKNKDVEVMYSKVNEEIAKVLKEYEFIEEVKVFKIKDSKHKGISMKLKYLDNKPAAINIERISKPSLRKYVGSREIETVLNGLGMYIISTPRGIMSSKNAKKLKLGGEVICKVF